MDDISKIIEYPERMPLCPICNNQILDYEPVQIVTAFRCKALAHSMCIDDDD